MAAAADLMVGVYQHSRSEDLEKYFAAIGVPWPVRKMIVNTSPSIEITKEGDKWTISTKTSMTNTTSTFTLDQPWEETQPMRGTSKVVATITVVYKCNNYSFFF